MQCVSVVCFKTKRVKIRRCLYTACGEENVMNLKNVKQWQSTFWGGRTNNQDDDCEGQPSMKCFQTLEDLGFREYLHKIEGRFLSWMDRDVSHSVQ